MYEVCTRQLAYSNQARMAVPELGLAAALTYGSRLTALVRACMALWPGARIGTPELVQALQHYCVTRWQKELAQNMWASIAVRAAAGAGAGGYGYGYGNQPPQVPQLGFGYGYGNQPQVPQLGFGYPQMWY
jgi:hypothetical protein